MSSDWDGTAYEQVSDLQRWLAARALDGLDLQGVRRVLDVGCGDGRVTARIAAALGATVPDASTAGLEVVGVDPSPRMLAAAATRVPAPGSAALRFEPGDVTSLPYDGAVDLVVSFNALHWVLDQQRALRRIAAALVPGGRALLVLVCAGPRPSLEDVASEVAATARWVADVGGRAAPYVHPDPVAFAALADGAGLTTLSSDVADLTWDFGATAAFARWCRVGFGAWTAALPDAAADAFVADVVAAYEPVAGAPGRFRFLQLRTELARGRG